MSSAKRPLLIVVGLAGLALAGCGSSSSASIPLSGKHETVAGSSAGRVVLTQLGAEHIGVRTAKVQAVARPAPPPPVVKTTIVNGVKHSTTTPTPAPTIPAGSPTAIIPYSAIVYDPSGKTYAFANIGPLTYVEVPVAVDHISGNAAYLVKGPRPGTPVVSVGAEELYGVQTGVLAQT
jgi:hypothetical protein